jgi:hypothetical protein
VPVARRPDQNSHRQADGWQGSAGSLALVDHPATVNLREELLLSALNGWIGELFSPENMDATVASLVGSQPDSGPAANVEAAKARRADADQRIRRFQAAITAEVYAMIGSLGDVGATLTDARPTALTRLYKKLNVSAVYQPDERAVDVTARPRVDSACVRGGSCALTTRLALT